MPLFQKNIVRKYASALKPEVVQEAYARFKAYFLDPTIQQNILSSKEEQFQEGFLRELFVNVLGYTINPDPEFNLITEQKNETNAQKADGAILRSNEVIGVIELKDHKTTNLSNIESQAFGYKHQHAKARYVIISNFEKLRFYIDNSTEYHEWHLFSLMEAEFTDLYTVLACAQIMADIPAKIKEESVSSEEQITNALYKDYSTFKRLLFADLQQNNPSVEPLILFKKSQKLLDRLLFIFFAEDSGLLPPNFMIEIINQWEQLKQLDEYQPMYNRIKKYFGYLDTGHQGTKYEIYAYNGGLFKPDEVLDSLIISDDLLSQHTRKLSEYDYVSDVDVNILGHIFENSLTEIDEITQQLESGQAPVVSKRKKDGVFYTPQYITKYIVENTVGRLCQEKKQELQIVEAEYFADKNRQTATKKRLLDKLDVYRDWLLNITICDPACGSGAFLNAALRFLMDEHKLLDEMTAKVTGSSIVFQNVENSILENNLYGVDINEESVEIAKFALWLRTAKPHRKLSSLNNNIKCGNSLISDPSVAGDKAFDWEKEFPQVFAKGGFDVVIGNPPYVRAELLPTNDISYYQKTYLDYTPDGDLFSFFYEKGLNLLNRNGLFGFISNTFDKTTAGQGLRHYINKSTRILRYVDFTEVQIFEGATTYPIILILSKQKEQSTLFPYIKIPRVMQGKVDINSVSSICVAQESLHDDSWSFQSVEMEKVMRKIRSYPSVASVYGKCYYGIKTALNEAFIIDKKKYEELVSQDPTSKDIILPVYEGKDLHRWYNLPIEKYLICTHNGYTNIAPVNITEYPSIKQHLDLFEPQLSKRYDKGTTPYNLRNCAYQHLFYGNKIIWGNLQNYGKFSFDATGSVISAPACMLPTDDHALLAVLNSKIVWLFLTSICVVRSGGYIEVKPQYFEQIPIPKYSNNVDLSALTDKMLSLNKELQEKRARFLRRVTENLGVTVTTALETFDTLSFKDFCKELNKQKCKLSLVQQDEWEEYFNQYATDCHTLTQTIQATDNQIDELVYDLYGLSEDEKSIIRNS